jgi:P-type Ca2+ transporter type 2C
LLSGVFGGFRYGWGGLGEGISILAATMIIMTIGTFSDLFKDKKFVSLQSLIKEEIVAVVRGKFGATLSVSVWDVVVGDIIILQAGARVPADCLIVEAADLETEE